MASLIVGLAIRDWLTVGSRYPWHAAAMMALMTIAALFMREPHPFASLGAANQITAIRALIVSLMAAFILEQPRSPIAALGVTLAAVSALLDGLDGWLARRTHMASALGARLDMETDALLIMVLSVLVWRYNKAGAWVMAGGLMRYAFIAAGWMLPWMAAPLTPTFRAKTVAIAHVVGLCVALAPIVPWPQSAAAAGSTTLALAWSFGVDVRRLWRCRCDF
jgi:phosphatidylglycerophosphate synthase